MNHEPRAVYWLIAAQQQLIEALAQQLAGRSPAEAFLERRAQLDEILLKTFPHASTIVVRERLHGFRPQSERHVLWVEAFPDPKQLGPHDEERMDPESHIVKIAENVQKLQDEWEGWKRCRPVGMYADSILTILRPGARDEQGRILSLIYGEGHSVLATGDAIELEEAFVDCCRFGSPSVASLQQGIRRLFTRLYRRYYRRSFVTTPDATLMPPSELKKRVQEGLEKWRDALPSVRSDSENRSQRPAPEEMRALSDDERLRLRRQSLRVLASCTATFFDPCDYVQFLLHNPTQTPRILCGCAHGDLHGRNILVSPMQDAVGSLCLFDYEDMRPDNAVGWDFIKLETELKIRVYPHLFKGKLDPFVRQVHRFEETVARRMEHIHDNGGDAKWEVPGGRAGERLARLILTIRSEAQRCLGILQRRQRDWLEEYYFLLLCYGCMMAKMPAYTQRELMAGYVAAGVAGRRLDLPWRTFKNRVERARQEAARQKAQFPADPAGIDGRIAELCALQAGQRMSYHACLACATVWSRAGQEQTQLLRAAVSFLQRLRRDFPHALEIDEELVLTHLELHQTAEATALLDEMEARYGNEVSDEILCRRGRQEKDAAVAKWTGPELTALVREHLGLALEWYQRAYERSRSYYPAINIASLKYLLVAGDMAAVKTEIDEAKKALEAWQQPAQSELVWFHATWGEFLFLRGAHEQSRQKYELAANHEDSNAQHKESMLRQLRLLLRVSGEDARRFWNEPLLQQVFGQAACQAVPPPRP